MAGWLVASLSMAQPKMALIKVKRPESTFPNTKR
jgi:hypothetical protein